MEQAWDLFKDKVNKLTIDNILKKKVYSTARKFAWMYPETKYQIRVRNMAWKKYVAYSSAAIYRNYKHIRNKVKKMVMRNDWIYKKKLIIFCKGNPKIFYGYMKRSQKVTPQVSPCKTRWECDRNRIKKQL